MACMNLLGPYNGLCISIDIHSNVLLNLMAVDMLIRCWSNFIHFMRVNTRLTSRVLFSGLANAFLTPATANFCPGTFGLLTQAALVDVGPLRIQWGALGSHGGGYIALVPTHVLLDQMEKSTFETLVTINSWLFVQNVPPFLGIWLPILT